MTGPAGSRPLMEGSCWITGDVLAVRRRRGCVDRVGLGQAMAIDGRSGGDLQNSFDCLWKLKSATRMFIRFVRIHYPNMYHVIVGNGSTR